MRCRRIGTSHEASEDRYTAPAMPPVVRRNCVTYKRARRSIRDAARQGADWHRLHTTLRGDGVNMDAGGRYWRTAEQVHRDPAPCEDARHCTTRRHDTHSIDCRELRYPWHPWNGEHVLLWRSYTRGGVATFHCALEPHPEKNLLEIPQWMFDARTVCTIRLE